MLGVDSCLTARAATSKAFRVVEIDRPQWTCGSSRWRVQDPAWVADRRRCRVMARDALRRSRRPARDHIRHCGHDLHRRRTRRAQHHGSRQDPGRRRADDHRLVGRFAIAVPQSGHGVGGAVGTARRGGQASAPCTSSHPALGICGAQTAGGQATRCRAKACTTATIGRRITPGQNIFVGATNLKKLSIGNAQGPTLHHIE